MKKAIGITLSLVLNLVSLPCLAEPILERIERTGKIRAGAWKNSQPFGYVNEKGEWVGYGIDMMKVIQSQVEKALSKPIELELIEVNIQNFLDQTRDRDVDVACGPISFTWNREKYIDFSVSYFVSGTQFLVKKGITIDSVEELKNKRLGVIPNTTNETILKTIEPDLQIISVDNQKEGLTKLQQGEIDAYVSDSILLEALRNSTPDPNAWDIIPQDILVSQEAYACVIPENDSHWRDIVNYSILRAIQGYVIEDPEFTKMFEGWFGSQGVTPYSETILQEYFKGILGSLERIPEDAF
ncbi:MAG: amino acid ABC transporter substrate-binding protein [Crocosphaera sp.]